MRIRPRSPSTGLRTGALALALALAAPALAVDDKPGPNDAVSKGIKDKAMLGMGMGKIGGDFYVQTTANLELNLGKVGLGLSAPLNLLAYDSAPDPGQRDQKTYFKLIRRSDWDEFSDFGKIVRFVRYGQKRDPIFLLAGQLWGAMLGHGTMVNRYTNSLLIDHKKMGLAFDVNSAYGGAETLLDNFFNPTVMGLRGYVRPLAIFGDKEGFFAKRLAIGSTFMLDRTAPRSLKGSLPDQDGDPTSLEVDAEKSFVVHKAAALQAVGVDLEFIILETSILDIIPYVDGNRILDGGNGLHAGTLFTFSFPLFLKLDLDARLEYRVVQPGYVPTYFDNFYDLQRTSYKFKLYKQDREKLLPKASALGRLRHDRDTLQGVYGEAAVDIGGWVQVGLVLEDYQGENNATLGSYAALPAFDSVQLSVSYFRKDFEGLKEAIKVDEKSILLASARVKAYGPLFINVGYNRTWVTDPGPPSHVRAVSDFSFGVDLDLPF